jgi:hypothetical protein
MRGWRYEGYRHSLAAKGIKTSFASKEELRKEMLWTRDTPFVKKLIKEGRVDEVAEVAAKIQESDPKISNSQAILMAAHEKRKHSYGAFEHVEGNEPLKFQDTNQEKIVHADWFGPKEDLYQDNELRFVLEGSGDIFREHAIHKANNFWTAQYYIDEKAARIKKYLTDKSLANHSVDEVNKAKLAELRRLWAQQPHETPLQKKAIDLNLAIIDRDNEKALSILKEFSKV